MLIKDGWLIQVEDTDITDGVFFIPDHVQEIQDGAFQKCRSPRKIIFSAGASYFAGFNWPFAFCRELERFEVDTRNREFCAEGGVLFGRERTRLFCYPMKKSDSRYRIPNTVTAIDNCAFRGCSELTEVIIPPGVRFIGDWAFDGCTGLRQIRLPPGLNILGDYAFRGCTSLDQDPRSAIEAIRKKTGLRAERNCESYAGRSILGHRVEK